MRIGRNIAWLSLLLSGCGTLQFQEMKLYDAYQSPAPEDKVEQVVYDDAEGTMWNSLFDCGEFAVTNSDAHSGNASIKLSWDKSKGCEWIGFGNSFSNWAPSDMSEQLQHKALSMYVRTISGSARAIPIVACLEDFGGGGSYLFIDAKQYLKGLEIDTNWRQMLVPLWDFPIDPEEVDIHSIKQMKFQLEGAGAFFLDEIKLVDYSLEQHKALRKEVEAMKPKGQPNQQIYPHGDFAFDVWGNEGNPCQTLEEGRVEGGFAGIVWEMKASDCKQWRWGINWNDWYAVNFRGMPATASLVLAYKRQEGANFKVMIEDFAGHSLECIPAAQIQAQAAGGWQQVKLPLPDLASKGFVVDQIKQLKFEGISPGKVEIKSISITER